MAPNCRSPRSNAGACTRPPQAREYTPARRNWLWPKAWREEDQPQDQLSGGLARMVVTVLVAALVGLVGAQGEGCTMLMVGQGEARTISSSQLNINFPADTVEVAGDRPGDKIIVGFCIDP